MDYKLTDFLPTTKKESLIEVGEEVDMPTEYGHFRLIPFRQSSNGLEHMALIKGEWKEDHRERRWLTLPGMS